MTKAKLLKLLEETDFPINKGRTNILKKRSNTFSVDGAW